MEERPFLRAVLSAVAVSLLFLVAGYAVVGLWQIGYCSSMGISVTDLPDHMEDYTAHADKMSTYMNIAMAGTALLMASLYFTLRKRSPIREMGVTASSPAMILAGALMGAGLQLPLGFLMEYIPFGEEAVKHHEELLTASASPLWVQIFYTVILAPVVEELLFRGIVHDRFAAAFPMVPAALLSAVVFGVAHGELISAVGAGLCGFVLGGLYSRGKSVLVPMAFHVSFNAAGFAATRMKIPDGIWNTVLIVLSVAVFAAGLAVLVTHKNK